MDVLLEKLKCLLDVSLFSIVFQTTKVINILDSCLNFMQEPISSSKIYCVSTLCGPHTYIVHLNVPMLIIISRLFIYSYS